MGGTVHINDTNERNHRHTKSKKPLMPALMDKYGETGWDIVSFNSLIQDRNGEHKPSSLFVHHFFCIKYLKETIILINMELS